MNIVIIIAIFFLLLILTFLLLRKVITDKAMPFLYASMLIMSFFAGFLINRIPGFIILALGLGSLLTYISKRKDKIFIEIISFFVLFLLGLVCMLLL